MYNILKKADKINKKIILFIVAIVLILPSIILAETGEKVIKDNMIKRPKASDVENMTLIYGTHMVYIASLTKELDNIIKKTVEDSNQNKIYYKSELTDSDRAKDDNNGAWYEVQSATSIDDISNQSRKMVSNDFIDSLQIDYYTPSDGKTYDLKTGKEIDIFDIENVYDISSMKELKALNLKYESLDKESEEENNKKEKESLESILKLDVRADETIKENLEKIDSEIDYLKKYSDYVSQKDDSQVSEAEKAKLSEIRAAKNAERKCIVVDEIINKIDEEIKNVKSLEESYSDANNELISSKTEYEAQKEILENSEDKSELLTSQVEIIKSLINNAKNNQYIKADENLKDLVALDNISSSIVVDKTREKILIDELEKKEEQSYFELVTSGESEEYKQSKVLNKSEAELDSLKNKYKDKLKRKLTDLTNINDTKLKLVDSVDEKAKILEDNIDKTNKYIGEISAELSEQTSDNLLISNKDEFKKIGLDSLSSRVSTLEDKAQTISDYQNKDSQDLKLADELQALKEERQSALDKNDLIKAKEAKIKIDNLEKTISNKQKEINDDVANLNSQLKAIDNRLGASELSKEDRVNLEKQKATVKSSINRKLSSTTGKSKVASNITKTATKDAKNSLSKTPMKKEDVTSLSDSISKIKSVASSEPKIAHMAMEEIDKAIKDKKNSGETLPSDFSDIADEVESAVNDYEDSYEDELNNNLTEENISSVIETFSTDKELDELTASMLALGSMSSLLEKNGEVEDKMSLNDLNEEQKIIKNKMEKLLYSILENSNESANNKSFKKLNIKLVDKKFKNSECYAPAEIVCDFKNMKYVWDRNLLKAWLIKKNMKYGFVQGKNSIILIDKNKVMKNPAIFEPDRDNMTTLLWLPSSFLLDEFGITVQSLNMINKSIVYDQKSYEIMKEMLKSFEDNI